MSVFSDDHVVCKWELSVTPEAEVEVRASSIYWSVLSLGLAHLSCGSSEPAGSTSTSGGSGQSTSASPSEGGKATSGGASGKTSKATGGTAATSKSNAANEGGGGGEDSTSGGASTKSSSKQNGGAGGTKSVASSSKSTAAGGSSANSSVANSNSAGAGGTSGGSGGATTGTTAAGGTPVCTVPPAASGTVITFNDDGGWCWYQDERVIVDTEANKMLIGSVATGSSRNGQVEVAIYDLANGGNPQRSSLGKLNPDDHNAPALTKLGKDKYLAVYTTHNDDCFSYYNVYENGKWGAQGKFDWKSYGCPTPNQKTVSYSNLWHMPENKVFNFVRSVETSPNLITTTNGSTWTFEGRLTSTPRVGYVAGYYKYWGNNVDRIDFLATEAHPRDEDNSLYHGYIKDGKSYDSLGKQIGEVSAATKGSAPEITRFTKVFATGTTVNGARLAHLWNSDITRYEDGTIVAIGQGRADGNTNDPDKRFIYMRFDGKAWTTTYLVRAGKKLYDSEQDYTGLGAVHPNDPNTIYVSTVYDPNDDKTTSSKHEIWRGTTCDNGKTFTWTSITKNSAKDQLRPVVPYWEGGKTALLWESGDYVTAQTYRTSIVGMILDGS